METPSDLALLADEWTFNLRARSLSVHTVTSYRTAVQQLDAFLADNGAPASVADIDRRDIEKYVIHDGEDHAPGTVLTRFRALRVFFRWLVDEGEIDRSPMDGMKEPRGEQKPPAVPADEDVSRVLKAISGRSFNDRRDVAMLRLMFDTGARISEITGLRVTDIDTTQCVATVYGKGRKMRVVPFGAKAAAALLAYLRVRRSHALAATEPLFLGQRGALTPGAARWIVKCRGEAVGVKLHPHMARHWMAHTWLADGNNEGDLRALGGWQSNRVMARYGASAAAERARDAHRRAAIADRL
jgi:site-specific recombinase XerD